MDLSAVYAADWAVVDDLITVTYTRQAQDYGTPQEVEGVLKSADVRRETDTGDALLEEITCSFNVWRAKLTDVLGDVTPPLMGDRLTQADGTVWQVTGVEVLDHGQRYRLAALRERSA